MAQISVFFFFSLSWSTSLCPMDVWFRTWVEFTPRIWGFPSLAVSFLAAVLLLGSVLFFRPEKWHVLYSAFSHPATVSCPQDKAKKMGNSSYIGLVLQISTPLKICFLLLFWSPCVLTRVYSCCLWEGP